MSDCFLFIRNGKSVKQNPDANGIPITRIETIADKSIDINRLGYANIDINNIGSLENYLLKEGDILMSHINSPKHLGKTAIYQNQPVHLIHGMNLLCLRTKKDICDSNYANYYFQSSLFLQNLAQISNKSVNQASFSVGRLKDLEIPLPPLKNQKQIASILDNAAALRDKTAQLLKEYDLLAQSIFLEMFGDPVKNPKSWKIEKLNNLCGVGSSRRVFVSELVESGIPFYRGKEIGALSTGEVINPDLFITQEHYDSLGEATGVPAIGDLLMPSICPDGRIYRVQDNEPFYFKDGRVLWIKVNQENINSYYLIFFLRELFRTSYSNIASGTTFAELKIVALKKIKTLVPPINLQNQFAEKIALIEQQKALAKQELQESENLFNCLLQKAFKGELV